MQYHIFLHETHPNKGVAITSKRCAMEAMDPNLLYVNHKNFHVDGKVVYFLRIDKTSKIHSKLDIVTLSF